MPKLLPFVGVLFTVILTIVAYFPLVDRLSQPDFQSLSYGSMILLFLPLFLTMFAVISSITIVYMSVQGGVTSK